MSLFQFQEWFTAKQENSFSLVVAKLIGERDQIIVGSLDGILSIFDPGRDPDHRNEMGGLVSIKIGHPILQLSTGYFLPSSYGNETIIIVTLTPSNLFYFKLNQIQDSYECEQIFVHKIPGPPAFNFCQGYFGKSLIEQICVQSLQGGLLLYEAENRILQRSILDILHPGPLGYSSITESLLITSGGYLRSVRYNTLIATGTKQINIDWSLPLGDWAIKMIILFGDISSSRPSSSNAIIQKQSFSPLIIILCKRIIYCITHNGSLKYSIRLQTVALSLHILPQRGQSLEENKIKQTFLPIPIIIGTIGKTLLFYSDTKLIWNVQLPFAPQIIETCTFSDSLRSMIVLLSEDSNNLIIGYLGTEPSLFRIPASESRFINFEEKKKELREYEKIIFLSGRENNKKKEEKTLNELFNIKINIDKNSCAFNYLINDGIKSATLQIIFNNNNEEENKIFNGEIILNTDLYCPQGNQQKLREIEKSYSFSLFCNEKVVYNTQLQLLFINEVEYHFIEISIPLPLICREMPAQKQAIFKLSIDSTLPTLDIDILFPEFLKNKKDDDNEDEIDKEIMFKNNSNNTENKRTSIALQPFFGESNTCVSLFTSTKTNRYRIQSDSTDFVNVIFSILIDRIQKNQPEARLHYPVPMHLCLTEISKQIKAEEECTNLEKQANRLCTQMRQVETVFLSKLKSSSQNEIIENNERMPIELLVEYSHNELIKTLDQLNLLNEGQLSIKKRKSLSCLLNLMNSTLKLNGIQLPFDGRIVEGNDQSLSEQLSQLLNSPKDLNKKLNVAEIGRLLTNFCERNEGNLGGIVEEEEEEENEYFKKEEEKELDNAITKSEAFMEFVELETGSLPQARKLNDL